MTTSTIFDLAEAVIEFAVGNEASWSSFQLPIPEEVVIYTSDTKRFKRGDGVHKFSELPDGPSLTSVLAGEQNIVNVLTTLVPNDTNAIIVIDNEIYKPSTTKLSDIAARLAAITAKDTIQEANMDAIVNQFTLVDNTIVGGDTGKLVAIGSHKMKPGIDPSTFVVAVPSSPIFVLSVGFYSDAACTKPVTKFYHDSTWYVKVNATHDSVDTDQLVFGLTDTNINTTITAVGRGVFKVVIASIATDTILTMTASALYGTDTASSVVTIPVSAASLMLISLYSGAADDVFQSVAVDSTNNSYCVGYTKSEGLGTNEALIVKFDSNLNILAKKRYGGSANENFEDVAIDASGNVYCVGFTASEGGGSGECLIVKYDSNLNILARKYYGGASVDDLFHGVVIDSAGNIICVGGDRSEGVGSTIYINALIVKFDSSLNILARKVYGGANDDQFISVTTDSSNNIICAGYTMSEGSGGTDALIVKFDTNLNILARKRYGGTGNEYFQSVAIDASGNIYCAGYTTSEGGGTWNNALIIKFDSNLNILAKKRYGGLTNYTLFGGVKIDSSNNVICVGNTAVEGIGGCDCLLVKFDSNLNITVKKRYGGTADDIFVKLCIDTLGNVICVGQTKSVGLGNNDALIIKLPSSIPTGTFTSTIISGLTLADVTTLVLSDSMLTLADSALTASTSALTLANSTLTAADSTLAQIFDDITLDNIKITTPISGHYPVLVSVYGGVNSDCFNGITIDALGSIYAVGFTTSEGLGSYDGIIVKFDSNLNILARKRYGGTAVDYFNGVATDTTGNVYVVGPTQSEGSGSTDALIIKFDSNLNILVKKRYGGDGADYFSRVAVDSSGNIFAVGETGSHSPAIHYDAFIVKFDSSLNIVARNVYGGVNEDYFSSVTFDSLGNVYAAGCTASEGQGGVIAGDALIIKFDTNLNILARKIYGGAGEDQFQSVAVNKLNNVICAGFTGSEGAGSQDALVVKFDSSLNILAKKRYGGTADDNFNSVAIDSLGNIVCCGFTASEGYGSNDALIVKFDTNLNVLAKKRYGGASADAFNEITSDTAGNAYCVGYTASVGSGSNDGLIVKFQPTIPLGTFGGTILTGMVLADSNLTLADSNLTLANSTLASSNPTLTLANSTLTLADSMLTQKYDEISFDGIVISHVNGVSANTPILMSLYGGTSADSFASVVVDASNNIICVGTTNSEGTGGEAIIIKYDTNLNILLRKRFGGSGSDGFAAVTMDSVGNFICVGGTNSEGVGGADGFIVKFDTNFNVLAKKYCGAAATDSLFAVATDASNNIYAAGYSVSTLGEANAILIKFDSNLNVLQSKQYGSVVTSEFFRGVCLDTAGNIICVGQTYSEGVGTTTYSNALIIKFDVNFNIVAKKIYGGAAEDAFYWVDTDSSNNIYAVGVTASEGLGGTEALIVKFDSTLNILAKKCYGGSGSDIFYNVYVDSSSNIYCCGYTSSEGVNSDATFVKFDSSLNIVARKRFSGAQTESFASIVTDTAGNIICVGSTNTSSIGGNDALIVKFPPAIVLGTYTGTMLTGLAVNDSALTLSDSALTLADSVIAIGTTTITIGNSAMTTADSGLTSTFDLIYTDNTTTFIPGHNKIMMTVYGGTYAENFSRVAIDKLGNIICVGNTGSEGTGAGTYYHALIVKYDANFNILARKVYGGSNNDYFINVVVDTNNNIICVGWTTSEGTNVPASYNGIIVKFDSSLNILARKVYGGVGLEYVNSVAVDSSNNIYTVGYTDTDPTGAADIFKFDSNLNNLIKKKFDGPSLDTLAGIAIDSSGNVFCCGTTYSEGVGSTTYGNGIVIKLDSSLNFIAKKVYGGAADDNFSGIALDATGNIICVGYTNSEGAGSQDALVVKFDTNLNILARKVYGGTGAEYFQSVAVDTLGNIICVGYTNSEGAGSQDGLIVKFDNNLNILAKKRYGGSGSDSSTGVAIDTNNNIICVGGITTTSAGIEAFAIKLPPTLSNGNYRGFVLTDVILGDSNLTLANSALTLTDMSTIALSASSKTFADSALTLINSALTQRSDTINT